MSKNSVKTKFSFFAAESQLKGVKTRLVSRGGLFLSVERDKGAIRGIPGSDESTIFFLIPVGLRIVSIQHMETMLYIAMSSEGKLYTSVSITALFSYLSIPAGYCVIVMYTVHYLV